LEELILVRAEALRLRGTFGLGILRTCRTGGFLAFFATAYSLNLEALGYRRRIGGRQLALARD
jgi:hypothetical protein